MSKILLAVLTLVVLTMVVGGCGTCPICGGQPTACNIGIEKSGPKEVIVDKEFTYTIKATNKSGGPAEGVVVSEQLPDNLRVVSTAPQSTLSGHTLTWEIGHMNGNQSVEMLVRCVSSQSGELTACTTVTCRPPTTCISMVATKPQLAVALRGPSDAILCDGIAYVATVTNTGSGTANHVKVSGNLPSGMTTLDGQSAVAFDAGDLAPNQSKEMSIATRVAKGGSYSNSVSAVADGGLSANSQTVSTNVTVPALVVTMSGPETRYIGRPADYTITVRNAGDGVAKNTMVTAKFASGIKVEKASSGGQDVGTALRWDLGTLNPGEEKTVTLTLSSAEKGDLRVDTTATAYCGEGTAATSTAIKGVPGLSFCTVGLVSAVEVGAQETYRTTITNQGSDSATNIALTCEIPAEQEYVKSSGPTDATVSGKTVTFAPYASLEPGKTITFDVVTKALTEGDSHFKTTLNSSILKTPVWKTESTHIYK